MCGNKGGLITHLNYVHKIAREDARKMVAALSADDIEAVAAAGKAKAAAKAAAKSSSGQLSPCCSFSGVSPLL